MSEARAGVAARISTRDQQTGAVARAVVMDVLLGFVGIVPRDLGLEACQSSDRARDVTISDAHDTFQRVHHGAGAKAIERVGPCERSRRLTASW